MTSAEYIIRFLQQKNVSCVFAYPGANVLRLYGLLCKSGIRVVLCRHEQGAVHAACGYARASGRTGVCIATSGPGATNLVTGVADAYLDSVPLLIITGQVPSRFIGRDAFQEADIMGITLPVTKHNYLIRSCREVPRAMEEAWRIANAPRWGPVLVDITSDLFDRCPAEEDFSFECLLPRKRENPYPLSRCKNKIARALESSFRPLILAGGGVVSAGGSEPLARLSEKTGIPVVFTMMGKGIACPQGARDYYGMAGVHGTDGANRALSQCDLLIAVGCRFTDRTVPDFEQLGRSRTVIHCDIDPAEIRKNIRADIPVVCDAAVFLRELAELYEKSQKKQDFSPWRSFLAQGVEPCETREADDGVYAAVNEYIASCPQSCVITDVGTSQTKAARLITTVRERGFITSGGLGAMGFGLPAAIGVAYAYGDCGMLTPEGRIILICGDGAFQMTMQELALLGSCPGQVKLIIINNGSLKMVRDMPSGEGGLYCLSDVPDFAAVAGAYGIRAQRITEASECLDRTSAFLAESGSALLEIKIAE